MFESVIQDANVKSIVVNMLQSIGPVELPPNYEPIIDPKNIKGYDLPEFVDDLHDLLSRLNSLSSEFKEFSFKPIGTHHTFSDDENNAIRYEILQRTPASLEQGAGPHNGRKSFKWMLRDIIDDPINHGYKILVYIKEFDNTINLLSYSKNYRDADRYAYFLEDTLDTYAHLFGLKGLSELRYLGRGQDRVVENSDVIWYGCPDTYFLRTTKVKLVREKTLEKIVIDTIIK